MTVLFLTPGDTTHLFFYSHFLLLSYQLPNNSPKKLGTRTAAAPVHNPHHLPSMHLFARVYVPLGVGELLLLMGSIEVRTSKGEHSDHLLCVRQGRRALIT